MSDTGNTSHRADAIFAIEELRHHNGNDDAYRAALRNVRALGDERDALAAERNRYRDAVLAALQRYDRADAENGHTGFVRGEVAWAMADDLRQALDADR